jgi:putative transcriptional regulator
MQSGLDVNQKCYENKILGKASVHFGKKKIIELGGECLIWS